MVRAVIVMSSVPIMGALCLGAGGASDSAESLFLEANGAFQKALESSGGEKTEKLREAASLYERMIDEKGIRNGYLYYNLGNCHFHLGEIGRAILNYRRAEKLVPNYSDLKRNLKSVIARRQDEIRKSQIRSISRTLFFWHSVLSQGTKIVVFSVFFSMIWILLLVRLFVDRSLIRWTGALSIFFAIVFGLSAAVGAYEERSVRSGVVLSEETVARKGPGESYAASFKEPLHEGTEFRVRDRQAKWFQVELENGAVCWIGERDVGLI